MPYEQDKALTQDRPNAFERINPVFHSPFTEIMNCRALSCDGETFFHLLCASVQTISVYS